MKTALKFTMLLTLAGLTAHCKTASNSGVKDADDITNGMEVQTSNVPFTWANQMGLTLDDGNGGAHISATRMATFATAIGLAADDIITALNGTAVSNAAGFETACDTFAGSNGTQLTSWNGEWIFQVQRAGQALTIQRPSGYNCDGYWLANCGPFGGSN